MTWLKGYRIKRDTEPGLPCPHVPGWDEHHLPCHPTQAVCVTLFGSCFSHPQGSSHILAAGDTSKSKTRGKLWKTRHDQHVILCQCAQTQPKTSKSIRLGGISQLIWSSLPQHSGFHPTAMPSSRVSQEAAHTHWFH